MPVTDFSGDDDDWLQQFMAGHTAGQSLLANYGAGQPYGASGYPNNLPNMAYGPPGGGVMGRQGATPGAPSMGYPAMGQLTPGALQPSPTGFSLTSNPITRALGALNPISSAQADILHPTLSHPDLQNPMGVNQAPSPSPLLRAGAADSLPLAYGAPTSQDYHNWLSQQLATSSPAAPATADPAPVSRGGSGYGGMPPSAWGATGANSARRGLGFNQTPGQGAPQGSPASTPRPPNSAGGASGGTANSRFVQVDRPNMPAAGGPRGGPPQMTALNLAGLFGGGQNRAPAANPANLPAPNAQPVSGPLAPSGMSNAPWNYGPLQQGNIWRRSGGPRPYYGQ